MSMDKEKIIDAGFEMAAETIDELTNGKGDDEECPTQTAG